MIKYVLKQNKNKKSLAFGKWYAFPVVEETMDWQDSPSTWRSTIRDSLRRCAWA